MLDTAHVDLVMCVGWMRVLGKVFTDHWEGCCLNLHLSQLPAFAGGMDLDVLRAVLDAGCS